MDSADDQWRFIGSRPAPLPSAACHRCPSPPACEIAKMKAQGYPYIRVVGSRPKAEAQRRSRGYGTLIVGRWLCLFVCLYVCSGASGQTTGPIATKLHIRIQDEPSLFLNREDRDTIFRFHGNREKPHFSATVAISGAIFSATNLKSANIASILFAHCHNVSKEPLFSSLSQQMWEEIRLLWKSAIFGLETPKYQTFVHSV